MRSDTAGSALPTIDGDPPDAQFVASVWIESDGYRVVLTALDPEQPISEADFYEIIGGEASDDGEE